MDSSKRERLLEIQRLRSDEEALYTHLLWMRDVALEQNFEFMLGDVGIACEARIAALDREAERLDQ